MRMFFHRPWSYFNIFLPGKVPVVIMPFLVVVEVVSYIARVFSLAIRLFANIIAGHTLLKILISFTYSMFIIISYKWFFFPLSFLPLLIVLLITFLEVVIAILQAYVFFVLVCLYIRDLYTHGH